MVNENSIKKKQFVQHITEMNTEPLKEILVNNAFKKYSNNSFLEKLNETFNKLKSKGNTSLNPYKGIGECSCNKDKNVFCFVGNKTKDYFTLSYQENEANYYNFSRSCSEVLYNEEVELNEFYHFLIKPEDALEYKKHQKYAIPLQDYKSFTAQKKCKMEDIESWLKKYNHFYTDAVKNAENNNLNQVDLLVDKEFEILYGKLSILRLLHQKEPYFKEQLKTYKNIKDSVSKLNEWFNYQHKNKNEYQLFSSVFYDNRELTHYQLKVDHLTLNTEDFKHTLEFIELIEDNMSIEVVGTIKSLKDLEIIEKTESRSSSKRREIVLSIDDFYSSEYLITFSEGRAEHLENVHEGQYVKVLARLIGGEWKNSEGKKEFYNSLYGWKIEELNRIPNNEKYSKEIEQYYKYTMIPPI